jgi:uncharacterized repeat protein (TIGR01451 family)
MSTIRLAALVAVVAIGALVLPGAVSANTGDVTCDSTGVVFHYNADFGRDKVVTETVNGVTKQITVHAHVATSDTWPVFGILTVGATWSGGSIPTVTLMCAAPTPPTPPTPPAPPVAPPAPPAPPAPAPVVTAPPAPAPAPAVATAPTTPPKITLTKHASKKTVPAGSTVRYTLVVKATGGTAHGVVVCDKLPDHMTYVSLGTATMENGKACWAVGDLTGSLRLNLTARVDADGSGRLTNNATATSSNAGRDTAAATVNVPAKHGVKGKLKRTAGVTG